MFPSWTLARRAWAPARGARRAWLLLRRQQQCASAGRAFCSTSTASTAPDLAALAPKAELFSEPTKWLVFSDLHVSARTRSVCLEVLETVRREAEARQAGVLFLGDFWHMRGALPVEPLNDVVRALAAWRCPTLMLVGNHDQVSLGGLVHSLTPLAAVSPYIHVFDRPTLYRGALWLPYRRNSEELEAAVEAGVAAAAAAGGGGGSEGGLQAIFAHVDVVGARMNDAFQAHDGLPPSLFPPGVPVFTGHYHKPHTVEGTSIRYVGSAYQVSRSEAGQAKALLVLDASQGWRVCEELPLDLGPRHFEAESEEELQALAGALRRGDRLRLTLPADNTKAQKKALKKLHEQGVDVEVVTPSAAPHAAPRLGVSEDVGPLEVLARYGEVTRMGQRALALASNLLKDLEASSGHALAPPATTLAFRSVTVEGYLSFKEEVTYPLGNRGLVVVTGRVEDTLEAGMESNGAGKTALMMAPLWALTGSIDTRSESSTGRGLTNADIINDDSKVARVRLEGEVNGVPFVVERTATKKGKSTTSKLEFSLDGEDRTGLEMKITQANIEEALGTALLGRAVFYGQSEVTALLESNDKDFKQELGKLVDLSIWAQAKERSKQELSQRRSQLAACTAQLGVHSGYLVEYERQLVETQHRSDAWEAAREMRAEAAQQDMGIVAQQLQQAQQQLAAAAAQLHAWMDHAEAAGARLAADVAAQEAERAQQAASAAAGGSVEGGNGGSWDGAAAATPLTAAAQEAAHRAQQAKAAAEAAEQAAGAAEQALQDAQYQLGAARSSVQQRQQALSAYQALAAEPQAATAVGVAVGRNGDGRSHGHAHSSGSNGGGGGAGAEAVCDRCLQPIDLGLYWQNVDRMQSELDEAQQAEQAAMAHLATLTQAAAQAHAEAERLASKANSAVAALHAAEKQAQVAALQDMQRQLWAQQAAERQLLLLKQELSSLQSKQADAAKLAQRAQQAQHGVEHASAWLAAAGSSSGVAEGLLEALGVPAAAAAATAAATDVPSSLAAGTSGLEGQGVAGLAASFAALEEALEEAAEAAEAGTEAAGRVVKRQQALSQEANPQAPVLEQLGASVAGVQAVLSDLHATQEQLETECQDFKQVDDAFRPTGIVNFVLEGVLADLQAAAARHLASITASITLDLLPCKPDRKRRGGAAKEAEEAVIEQVQKVIHVRQAGTGELRQRSVKQLSGGERRRVAVALALGFSELAAQRGRLRSNLLVLDEVMQHLDEEGCLRVASVLKQLPYSSVLVVAQAHSYLTQVLDAMDVVVKQDGSSVLETSP